jgi:glycosyltransferase 2 family protein
VFGPVTEVALRKLGRDPLPRTLPFSAVARFMVMYVGTWAAIGLGLCAFASALHPLDAGDFPYVAAAYPVAFCVAVLTFIVPSGLGTRDAALATAMNAVLPGTVATAIAVAFRIFQTLIELVFVGTVVWLQRRAGRR